MKLFDHRSVRPRAGFTLAEVAVTLVIVGIALVLILQGINTSRRTAAHTYYKKVALEMALLTLGELESGLFWEEMDDRIDGNYGYVHEDYADWSFVLTIGEDNYTTDYEDPLLEHDSFLDRDEREREAEEASSEDDEDEEEEEEPYEKVRITVTYPLLGDLPNELTIERWVPWKQVYGEDEDEAADLEEAVR